LGGLVAAVGLWVFSGPPRHLRRRAPTTDDKRDGTNPGVNYLPWIFTQSGAVGEV
jgi:hypothetical protein